MAGIEWREPPTKVRGDRSGQGRWYETLGALRERPGEWAYVGVGARTTASIIKSGRLGGAQPGEFDATARKRDDGQCDLYARYVGGEPA